MRPAMRTPFITRDASDELPKDPGARWRSCWPWDCWPTPWKPWRLTTPWKPLPFEVPTTFTFSPSAKISTVIASPKFFSIEKSRNSFTNFFGVVLDLAKWFFSEAMECFSFLSPNANWWELYPSLSFVFTCGFSCRWIFFSSWVDWKYVSGSGEETI